MVYRWTKERSLIPNVPRGVEYSKSVIFSAPVFVPPRWCRRLTVDLGADSGWYASNEIGRGVVCSSSSSSVSILDGLEDGPAIGLVSGCCVICPADTERGTAENGGGRGS